MDVATLVGLVLAFATILIGMTIEGVSPTALIVPAAIIIVVPTTLAVSLATGYMTDISKIIAAAKNSILTKKHSGTESIDVLVKFAERARREGLLALEDAVKEVDDPFLRKGIEMAIDGTDPEQLAEIMEAEIAAKRKEFKVPAAFFTAAGGFAPTIGVMGTCISLIHVLHNLSDPGSLGPSISSAFTATLLGIGSANTVYLPLAGKIKRQGEIEAHHMELVLEGVLSIQAGSNPRVIQQKLSALLGEPDASKDDKAA